MIRNFCTMTSIKNRVVSFVCSAIITRVARPCYYRDPSARCVLDASSLSRLLFMSVFLSSIDRSEPAVAGMF